MIPVRSRDAVQKMRGAGERLGELFLQLADFVRPGITTLEIEQWVSNALRKRSMISQTKGYCGYRHVSCVSVNDVVVHGVPSSQLIVKSGDIVKVDICAAWRGYCADAARIFLVGDVSPVAKRLASVAESSFEAGIANAVPGKKLFDISAAVQEVVESAGFGVVRDFCGHGIGRKMHEEPEIPNYGRAGTGPILQEGMTFAIEPMLTEKNYEVFVDKGDGWSVFTCDGGLSAHYENTILITANGPEVLTKLSSR